LFSSSPKISKPASLAILAASSFNLVTTFKDDSFSLLRSAIKALSSLLALLISACCFKPDTFTDPGAVGLKPPETG